ncbi:Opioid-binding protein/cell adhesion molecule -like protein [Takifugu flavidus]|uniref:Opioid-binding protein/cell adhesion molecule-like protein n=1 Tax=Takifugu flavidus TaxID=433684 RepID=A0A5C6P7U0_9TELE|nr:Opioid-binding protein/cell adhesion molecule -like protein [Takifugu flavidus]
MQRCNVDGKVSRVAWLNRTTILFAGNEKWSLDPRVTLLDNTAVTEYSIKIQNVDIHDEGPYVCSILTNKKPKSTKVHLVVQGPVLVPIFRLLFSFVGNLLCSLLVSAGVHSSSHERTWSSNTLCPPPAWGGGNQPHIEKHKLEET